MDRLIQMGTDLGYEGEKLQDFVKQQQDYERGERIAERELERDRIASQEKESADGIAAQDKERELERDKIVAQEKERADKLAAQEKDREIELARIATEKAKIAADERLEMARIEGMAEQAERDRELKRTELETDRESKLSSEIELEKLKHSYEMNYLELMGQLEVQRASFQTQFETQKSENLAHARVRNYRTLKKVKTRWIVICQDLRNTRQQVNGIKMCGPRIWVHCWRVAH